MSGSIDRRRFLGSGASALALASLPAFAEDAPEPFAGFKLGAQSYTFREFDSQDIKLGMRWMLTPDVTPMPMYQPPLMRKG